MKTKLLLVLFVLFSTLLFADDEITVDGQIASGHIIQDEGTTLTQDPVLNFVGGGVTASRISGKTTATIPSATIDSGWTDGGSNVYLTTTSDNVGIGTSSPSAKLHILTAGTGTARGLIIQDNAGTDRVTFLDNGNVGIATTNPTQKLDISGTANATTITEGGNAVYNSTETPGGELGGTWETPTVDSTHSGSAHHSAVTLAGTPDYITLSGQEITRNKLDMADDLNTFASSVLAGNLTDETGTNLAVFNNAPTIHAPYIRGAGTGPSTFALRVADTTPTDRLVVLDNGNVGIGLTNPAYALDVVGDINASGNIYATDYYTVSGDMGALGNVGAGTTAPVYRLDVRGSGNAILNMTGNVGIGVTSPLALLQVGTSPSPGLFITSGGNVGIGQTAATQKLDVSGTIAGTTITGANVTSGANPGHTHTGTSLSGIDISDDTNLSGDTENVLTGDALSIASGITRDTEWNGLDFLVGTATGTLSAEIVVGTAPGGELGNTWASPTIDDSLAVTSWTLTTPTFSGIVTTGGNYLSGDGGAEGIAIDTSGSVGIGTTGPGADLHTFTSSGNVWNKIETTGAEAGIWMSETGGSEWYVYNKGEGSNELTFESSSGVKMTVQQGGNVGIGTTGPGAKLEVAGTSKFGGILNTDNNYISGDGGTEGVYVADDGNVGIGTTNPGRKLEVAGLIKTTDTKLLMSLNIYNPDSSFDGIGTALSKTKAHTLTEANAIITAGTNVVFTLKTSPSSGTGPYTNLSVGQTATTSLLTVTSPGTVPSGVLLLYDTVSTSSTGTNTMYRLEVWGIES